MQTYIRIRRGLMPIIPFAYKQNKKGVPVRIRKDQGRKTIPHVFTSKMKSGHIGVYKRVGKKRYPIKELYTISVAGMVSNEGSKVFEKIVSRNYGRIYQRELQFYLGKKRRVRK